METIFQIETTPYYQRDILAALDTLRQQVDELERKQQDVWKVTNEPSPAAIAGFIDRKYPRVTATASMSELFAGTCEVRLLIARRRLAIQEAGLTLKSDDWMRFVVKRTGGRRGVLVLATFKDDLTKQREREVDGEEVLIPFAGEVSRAMVSPVNVLREWKAARAAVGNPFVQPKRGREPWTTALPPRELAVAKPPTPEELRRRELEDDFEAYLKRERAIRELGEPRAPWPEGLKELLEHCDETRLLAADARKKFRENGELTEPVPFKFYWSFVGPAFLPAVFAVKFNGVNGPIIKMDLWHSALPIRAAVAPEKALKEWQALRIERGEIEPPGPSIEEELVSLDLDNVTPRQAADILRELQARALKANERREGRAVKESESRPFSA